MQTSSFLWASRVTRFSPVFPNYEPRKERFRLEQRDPLIKGQVLMIQAGRRELLIPERTAQKAQHFRLKNRFADSLGIALYIHPRPLA